MNTERSVIPDDLEGRLEFAKRLTKMGAKLAKEYQISRNFQIFQKGRSIDENVFTSADVNIQKLAQNEIKKQYPRDGFVGEEYHAIKESQNGFMWVIDPIDGTKNYLNMCDIYGVSIGVLFNGAQLIGVLSIPHLGIYNNVLLHAVLGGGTYINDTKINAPKGNSKPQLRVLSVYPPRASRWFVRNEEQKQNMGDVRFFGSYTYEIALLVSGQVQLCLNSPLRVWDVAAATLIAKEAGAKVGVFSENNTASEFLGWVEQSNSDDFAEQLYNWNKPFICCWDGLEDIFQQIKWNGQTR